MAPGCPSSNTRCMGAWACLPLMPFLGCVFRKLQPVQIVWGQPPRPVQPSLTLCRLTQEYGLWLGLPYCSLVDEHTCRSQQGIQLQERTGLWICPMFCPTLHAQGSVFYRSIAKHPPAPLEAQCRAARFATAESHSTRLTFKHRVDCILFSSCINQVVRKVSFAREVIVSGGQAGCDLRRRGAN